MITTYLNKTVLGQGRKMKKIVFFIQSPKPYGGAHTLYLDLASYIADNMEGCQAYYINYYYPEVERDYNESKLEICNVETVDYNRFEGATFFVSINYLGYLLSKIKHLKKAKICIYFFHPNVFFWYSNQFFRWAKKPTDILSLIAKENAYAFMDKSNYLAISRKVSEAFNETYVPVTMRNFVQKTLLTNQKELQKNEINIGWLGRLDMDKVYSITNLADNLLALDSERVINFHIVGDGTAKKIINVQKYSPQIRFIFTSYMYGEERDLYIRDNFDIGVAMGVSALDIARIGIPTVIPIVSSTRFRNDDFVYLFDVDGHSLGWSLEDKNDIDSKFCYLEEIIDDVYNRGLKFQLGKKCKQFAEKQFGVKSGASYLVKAIQKTTLTVEKCLKCPSITQQMKLFKWYSKIRKTDDYGRYHQFVMAMNRLKDAKISVKRNVVKLKIKNMFKARREK
jgi:hypothetical protein